MERKLISVDNIVIGGLQTLTITPQQEPPTTLQLIREVKLDYECITMAAHGNDVYVGTEDGKILKVSDKEKIEILENVNDSNSCFNGFCVYGENLYCLTGSDNPFIISKYDIRNTIEQVHSWNFDDPDAGMWGSKIAITQNQLVVADIAHSRLTIFSLTGQLIRYVDCPQFRDYSWVCICVSPSNSDVIIVSDYDSDRVFAVNLTTRAVLWTNSDIINPQGIVSYGSEHILVTKTDSNTQLWILNANTGQP